MFLALGAHRAAVIPVEVVQVGVVVVGFFGGVGHTARIVTPRSTLKVQLSLGARLYFVVFRVHTHVEFIQGQSATGEGEQQGQDSQHDSC